MDIKFTIFLYSKYSKNSNQFMDIFKEKVPENIVSSMKFNSICIDNEKIRKSILNSKQISIKVVPCILIVYTDGGAQKFEGPDAFIWLEDIITKINMDIEKEQQILYEKQVIEQEKEQIILEKRKLEEERISIQMMNEEIQNIKQQYEEKYNNENIEDEYEEEDPLPPPPPPPKKKKEPERQNLKKLPLKTKVSNTKKTSIDELESENEDEAEQHLEEIFESYEEEEVEKDKNKDALSLKKESLMSAAMAMQKSRESQDSSIKKPMISNR